MYDPTHNFPIDGPRTSRERQVEDPPPIEHKVSKLMLAVLSGIALVLALIAVDVVLINGVQHPPPRPVIHQIKLTGAAVMPSTVYMSVSPGVKPGPDGKLHDAFSVTAFNVHAGQPVKLVIDNTDSAKHSITSPAAGVNIVVRPGTHTYTLVVQKSGVFQWYCNYPCDPYSMMHDGYMRGTITSI